MATNYLEDPGQMGGLSRICVLHADGFQELQIAVALLPHSKKNSCN